MDLQLAGKTALVTGSTAGIGLAIATSLAGEGTRVFVNGRSKNRVDQAIASIKEKFPEAILAGAEGDVGNAQSIAKICSTIPAVDILINNAGIFEPKEFGKISDEDWLRFFEVNVMSGVRFSRHYLPGMLAKNWGRIIFISSESAVQIPKEMIHYGMTKTAQLAISRGLAELTIGTNVTVNSVLPGPTASEGVETFVKDMSKHRNVSEKEIESEFFKSVRPSSLLQRFASVEEVANMVTFVASPRSSATNGSALRVDGGVVRSIL
jgi:NAD(P)-dependent dehydrogenase (short-subunit alcohol dehydrogenase family)